ncbi:hypothetical protein GGG16DRAFT_112798 [Schizophyllum commune]
MGTISCLLPSSAPFRLPHIRHRQPALDSDTNADELASAVNALPGSPNVTTTGQPNDLLDVKMAPSSQGLASASNVPRGSPMPLQTGSSTVRHPRLRMYSPLTFIVRLPRHHPLDLAMLRKRINVFTSSGPNTTAIGLLNDLFKYSKSAPLELTMRIKCINVLSKHLKIKLLDLLQQQMLRKSVNVLGSSPNAADTGGSMTPSSLLPHDAMQARQYIATSPNGAVVGQRNVLVDV